MHTHGEALLMVDAQNNQQYDTFVGNWRKRRAHWGGRGVSGSPPVSSSTDMPFIRCKEERGYEVRLSNVLKDVALAHADQVLDSRLCAFARPFTTVYIIENTRYWWKNVYFENRLRRARFPVFAFWKNVENFALRRTFPTRHYVLVSAW